MRKVKLIQSGVVTGRFSHKGEHLEEVPHVPNLERMAKAICSAWPKPPDGCAAICMQRLGDLPPEGCRWAVDVHGERARLVLTKTSLPSI